MIVDTPQAIAEKGDRIYQLHKEEFEKKYTGKFVAIDVTSEKAYVADTPEGALEKAQVDNPKGLFHLMRIGSEGVYRVGYTGKSSDNWIFQRQ